MERAIENAQILEKCAKAYLLALISERKINHLPLAIREIVFQMLRKDEKKAEAANLKSEID